MIEARPEAQTDRSLTGRPFAGAAAWRPCLCRVLLVLLPLAVFLPAAGYQFVDWDDRTMVYENPFLRPGATPGVSYFWQHAYYGLYIPLTYSLYGLLALGSGGLNPQTFHLAGVTLHVGCTLVVFALLRRLVGRDSAATGGALLFSLHPAQVEPVAWVGGLDTVLCTFFSLLALWQYVCYAQAARDGAAGPWRCYAAASLFFALALLSKPAAVAVPLVAAVLDFAILRRDVRRNWAGVGGWLLASALWAALTRAAQPLSGVHVPPVWERPFVAGDALFFYLTKLAAPVGLAVDYGRTPGSVLHAAWGHWTWLLPAAAGAAGWRFRKSAPWLLPALAVSAAALLPTLGLVPFAFQNFSTVADRYLSLALLGPAWAFAALLSRPRPATVWGGAAAGLVLLGVVSAVQVRTWRDSVTLFTHSLAVNPRSEIMHYNLASALEDRGRRAEAMAHDEAALRLNPANAQAHCNLAAILAGFGRDAEATREYRAALQSSPDLAPARYGLGLELAAQGRVREAAAEWTAAVRVWPDYVPLRYNLGLAQAQLGETDQARASLEAALRLRPGFPPARQRLAALRNK